MRDLKEAILKIDYQGDIGYAFVNNELVADNFNNGASWEIGLDNIYRKIPNGDIYISISPLKENQVIKVIHQWLLVVKKLVMKLYR